MKPHKQKILALFGLLWSMTLSAQDVDSSLIEQLSNLNAETEASSLQQALNQDVTASSKKELHFGKLLV